MMIVLTLGSIGDGCCLKGVILRCDDSTNSRVNRCVRFAGKLVLMRPNNSLLLGRSINYLFTFRLFVHAFI